MRLGQRLKFFLFEKLYGRKIYRLAEEWHERVKSWNIDKWKEYWISKINEKLRYEWNREFYKVSEIESLENLLEIPIQDDVPKMNIKKKILGYSITSGTTGEPKVIPFTKDDFKDGFKTFRFFIKNDLSEKRMLFVSTGMEYTSGQYFELGKRIIKSTGRTVEHFTLKNLPRKKVPKWRAEVLSTIICHIYPILEKMGKDYFEEEIDVALTGDIITRNLVNSLENVLRENMIGLREVLNMYAASEVVGLIAASDRGAGFDKLAVYPEVIIPYIQRMKIRDGDIEVEDKLTPIWMANRGDIGYFVMTSIRDNLLINYRGLKDIVKVMDPSIFPPLIYPLGRVGSKVELGWSNTLNKNIEGYFGTIVRTAGIPLNYHSFVNFLAKIFPKSRFFVYVEDKGFKATIRIYTDRPIKKEKIVEEIQKSKDKILNLFLLENLEIEVIEHPAFIKEVYEELPNIMAERYRRSPKTISYLVVKL